MPLPADGGGARVRYITCRGPCGLPKPESEFYTVNRGRNVDSVCRACRNSRRRPSGYAAAGWASAYVEAASRIARAGASVLGTDVTVESLRGLRLAQGGACAWTGVPLLFPEDGRVRHARWFAELGPSEKAEAAVLIALDPGAAIVLGNLAFIAYAASLLYALSPVFSRWRELGAGLAAGAVVVPTVEDVANAIRAHGG